MPRDVYGRLKALEERVLALEKKGVLANKHAEVQHGNVAPQANPSPAAIPVRAAHLYSPVMTNL